MQSPKSFAARETLYWVPMEVSSHSQKLTIVSEWPGGEGGTTPSFYHFICKYRGDLEPSLKLYSLRIENKQPSCSFLWKPIRATMGYQMRPAKGLANPTPITYPHQWETQTTGLPPFPPGYDSQRNCTPLPWNSLLILSQQVRCH